MDGQVLTPWLYRRWRFDFPTELYPAVLARLSGLPPRADEIGSMLTAEQAVHIPDDGWSIQCHLAHIADLDHLIGSRLDAYERGDSALPAADMSNKRTTDVDHNDRELGDVLSDLRATRMATVERLAAYDRDFFGRSAFHERLGIQKRVVDTCVFFADHDDHHLALIEHIRRGF
jgi:uncharacterized damage-inducible protein DinB